MYNLYGCELSHKGEESFATIQERNSCFYVSHDPADILRPLNLKIFSIKVMSLWNDNDFACTLSFPIADYWKVMIN